MPPRYGVRRVRVAPDLSAPWEASAWADAPVLDVGSFRPEGSDHRPRTVARLLYDGEGIHGIFRVEDRYVRSVRNGYGAPVYRDSCVEFFVRPVPGSGYLNFEFNAGGSLLAAHVVDPTRTAEGFRDLRPLPETDGRLVSVRSSLPPVVDPELPGPLVWTLAFFVPFVLLLRHAGAAAPAPGDEWRGNLYKCGDETSHPHWASWAPVPERNFHLPDAFGTLVFL